MLGLGTFAQLRALDMAGDPPHAFSRPVDLPGGKVEATFRTVTVRQDVFPAGQVYFCEHGTPELVWRPPLWVGSPPLPFHHFHTRGFGHRRS